MKATNLFKTLSLITVTSLAVGVGAAHADYGHSRGPAGGNPYLAAIHGGPEIRHHRQDDRHGQDHYRVVQPRGAGFYAQVEQRQDRQMDRIQYGIERGEITKREAAKLFLQQRDIERLQRQFMADGHFSRAEYLALERALDNASANIRHQANDNEWRW